MEEMTGLDARFLYTETAVAHMHTIKVAVVDVSARPDVLTPELFVELLAGRLDRMPILRRRVVPVPHQLGAPLLVDDPEFDLARHVRLRTAAPPGGDRELAQIVADVAAEPLPRDRPLWELTVVDGLAQGQMAFVVKIHHSLADGVAAVAMLMNAFMIDDSAAVVEPFRPEPLPSNRVLYHSAVRGAIHWALTLPAFIVQTWSALVRGSRARRIETIRVFGPFAGRRTQLSAALSPARTFAMVGLPMADLAAAKAAAGVTLNDVFLAVCGGGLRRYLGRINDLPDTTLVASVPVATQTERQRLSGNHVDNLFLPIRSDLADPMERLHSIHDATVASRRIRAAFGHDLFELRAGFMPPALLVTGARLASWRRLAGQVRPPLNLVASNVAGPRVPLELDGGVVTALYSVGPILEGIGLNITAWSYVDTMYVSLLGCPQSLPDPWVLAEDLKGALAEILDHL